MNIINIMPCNDWFYVGKLSEENPVIHRVAVWGLTDKGEVVGLISIGSNLTATTGEHGRGTPRLVIAPPVSNIEDGCYVPSEQLTKDQLSKIGLC